MRAGRANTNAVSSPTIIVRDAATSCRDVVNPLSERLEHLVVSEGNALAGLSLRVIDSHTAGEPTRVIIEGGPDLGNGSLRERLVRFRETADVYRQLAINEPRGSEALVGALLCPPTDPSCVTGVIFFNNAGYLGMCGHGTIGVAVTLAHMGRIGLGTHWLETPVGNVAIELLDEHRVAIENVPSYRYRDRVDLDVPSLGLVTGDIAWGGNWFFLVDRSPVALQRENIRQLSDAAEQIKQALRREQITGADGEEIEHIEFCGPPVSRGAHGRNFVYCPGGAFDRSPCGTGTSAKLACLAADGILQPGATWVQESMIGSQFSGSYREGPDGCIVPRIVGQAYLCGEGVLLQQPGDPFPAGINWRETA